MKTDIASIVLGLAVVGGCSSEPGPVAIEQVAQAQAPLEKVPSVPGDEASPHALIVHWEDPAPESARARTIGVVLENTSDSEVQVELEIVGLDEGDSGRELARSVGGTAINARQSKSMRIGIDLVPVQTVGSQSVLWVRATYSLEAHHPFTGKRHTFRHVAVSEPRHATFDEGFSVATLRDYRAQLHHNDSHPAMAAITAKRVFEPESRTMRTAPPSGFKMSFHSVPAGSAGTPPPAQPPGEVSR